MISSFTSESVASGHPDKICDQISDAIVDEAIRQYPKSRVAVETLVTINRIVLAGEVTCPKKLDYEKLTRKVIRSLGYTKNIYNFTYKSPVSIYIHQQSPDISVGVDSGGAGDQGMMFGYATDETPELMPLPITLAHKIVERLDEMRQSAKLPFLRPDGKSEVKVIYENGRPKSVEHVIIAVPHDPKIPNQEVKIKLIKYVILPVLTKYKLKLPDIHKIIVNGTGKWEIGGPASDTGVTGRKIIVDSYGGMGRHGGGGFSGKDPTKVDRSGAYACRYLAKNIVAHKLASKCEVRVAYLIGQREPIDKQIDCFGTEKKNLKIISDFADNLLNFSVGDILEKLDLQRPIYQKTARYGHFGNKNYPWEKIA
ncbi:methionine adenosyltransferase [Candidatus Microgenomates bacterium]|nr:methionine adenosyltransferase [Candidatus Microgenomates bacterium]